MSTTDNVDFFKSEEWKKYEAMENEKRKSKKTGPNVIHLEYLSPLFLEQDIKDYDEKVKGVGLQLSHYDKNGTIYANLDTYNLAIYLAIAQPLIGEILKGLVTSATWDVIKSLLLSAWKKIRKQKYSRLTSSDSEKKEITFGLKVYLDRNTSINMKLDGNVDESIIHKSIDQVLDFLRDQKHNEKFKNSDFAYFDNDKSKWIKVDVDQEIRKMIEKNEINKK